MVATRSGRVYGSVGQQSSAFVASQATQLPQSLPNPSFHIGHQGDMFGSGSDPLPALQGPHMSDDFTSLHAHSTPSHAHGGLVSSTDQQVGNANPFGWIFGSGQKKRARAPSDPAGLSLEGLAQCKAEEAFRVRERIPEALANSDLHVYRMAFDCHHTVNAGHLGFGSVVHLAVREVLQWVQHNEFDHHFNMQRWWQLAGLGEHVSPDDESRLLYAWKPSQPALSSLTAGLQSLSLASPAPVVSSHVPVSFASFTQPSMQLYPPAPPLNVPSPRPTVPVVGLASHSVQYPVQSGHILPSAPLQTPLQHGLQYPMGTGFQGQQQQIPYPGVSQATQASHFVHSLPYQPGHVGLSGPVGVHGGFGGPSVHVGHTGSGAAHGVAAHGHVGPAAPVGTVGNLGLVGSGGHFGQVQQPTVGAAAGAPQGSTKSVLTKALGKAPTFSGVENVRGWLAQLEGWCKGMQLGEDEWALVLVNCLKGDALDFMHTVRNFMQLPFSELRDLLLENYGAASEQFFHRLRTLRRGTMSVPSYIAEFKKLRNQADLVHTDERQLIAYFVDGLEPEALRYAVEVNDPQSLQRAFTIATKFAVRSAARPAVGSAGAFGGRSSGTYGTGQAQNTGQNPNRVQCPKCRQWHHKSVEHKCASGKFVPGGHNGAKQYKVHEMEVVPEQEVVSGDEDVPECVHEESDVEGEVHF